jgi:hypothetical protein
MQFQRNFIEFRFNYRKISNFELNLNSTEKNGVQIGIESNENLLIIMMSKKENFKKKTLFYPSTQKKTLHGQLLESQ